MSQINVQTLFTIIFFINVHETQQEAEVAYTYHILKSFLMGSRVVKGCVAKPTAK